MTEQPLTERKFTILTDKPADEDNFGGGGHQRSAQALSAAITKVTNEDGAIGLEGGWGAGKSSVVRFAAKILDTKKDKVDYRVFTFDLWAHGMHDIRRPLLEELVAWASSEQLLADEKSKENYLNRIRDRTETVKRWSTPIYDFGGIVAILLAPLIPLALTWLSPFAFRDGGPEFSHIASIASISIMLFLYFVLIIQSFRKGGISKALSLVTRESDVEEQKRDIRRREPATTEFQSIFRDIIADIQRRNRRVVLILDNIDRIAEGRLADAWAEVRSVFAAHKPGESEPQGKNAITVVVPYDFQYVAEALCRDDHPAPTPDALPLASSTSAEGLVRKSFKAVIRVAPPISADWEEYFYLQLDAAITPNLDQAEKYRLFKIFEIAQRSSNTHPTPRDIITYINDIIIYAEQWYDKISLEAIALFIGCRRRLIQNPDDIIAEDLVSDYSLGIASLDSDWRTHVAALFYNIETAHANQVMLEYRLSRALTDETESDLASLAKLQNFASALSDIVNNEASDWASASPLVLNRVAERIGALKLLDFHSAPIWRKLAESIGSMKPVSVENYDTFNGLRLIIERQPDATAVEATAKALIQKHTASLPPEAKADDSEGWDWFRAISAALDTVKNATNEEHARAVARSTAFPSVASVSLNACACAGDPDESVWPLDAFQRAPNSPDNLTLVNSWVPTDADAVFCIIRSKAPFLNDKALASLMRLFLQRLRHETLAEERERKAIVNAITEAALQLKQPSLISDDVLSFFNDGVGVWHIGAALEADKPAIAANLVWLAASFRSGDIVLNQPAEVPALGAMGDRGTAYDVCRTDADQASALAPQIAAHVGRQKGFVDWQEYAIKSPDDAIKVHVYRNLVDRKLLDGLNDVSLAERFSEIRELLSEKQLEVLLDWVAVNYPDISDELKDEGSLAISPDLIRHIADNDLADLKQFGASIDAYLLQFDAKKWRQAIEEGNPALNYLMLRIETNAFKPKAQPFRDAIRGHLVDLAQGNITETLPPAKWGTTLDGLTTQSLNLLVKEICSSLSSVAPTGDGARRLSAATPRIIVAGLKGTCLSTVSLHVIAPLIGTDISLASELVGQASPNPSRLDEGAHRALKEALGDANRGELSEDSRNALTSLSKMLGLHIEVENEPPKADEPGE